MECSFCPVQAVSPKVYKCHHPCLPWKLSAECSYLKQLKHVRWLIPRGTQVTALSQLFHLCKARSVVIAASFKVTPGDSMKATPSSEGQVATRWNSTAGQTSHRCVTPGTADYRSISAYESCTTAWFQSGESKPQVWPIPVKLGWSYRSQDPAFVHLKKAKLSCFLLQESEVANPLHTGEARLWLSFTLETHRPPLWSPWKRPRYGSCTTAKLCHSCFTPKKARPRVCSTQRSSTVLFHWKFWKDKWQLFHTRTARVQLCYSLGKPCPAFHVRNLGHSFVPPEGCQTMDDLCSSLEFPATSVFHDQKQGPELWCHLRTAVLQHLLALGIRWQLFHLMEVRMWLWTAVNATPQHRARWPAVLSLQQSSATPLFHFGK